jgi:hypothetical protein
MNMKTNLLIMVMALGMLTPALAQYKPIGDDGIAASPKLRQFLDAQKAQVRPPVTTASVATVDPARPAGPGIVASPKFLELRATRSAAASTAVTAKTAAPMKRCAGCQIVASPKMLELNPQIASRCCGMSSCVVACTR